MKNDRQNPSGNGTSHLQIDVAGEPIQMEIPAGIHPPPSSSIDLANLFDIHPEEDALDLGCGCGLLSIAAVKRGARRVIATDSDPRALASTLCNATANGVQQSIEVRNGSWYEALHEHPSDALGPFPVILATPPQTPAPRPCGPRYGGWDGTDHLRQIIGDAPKWLTRPGGRLWLVTISLAHPARVMQSLSERFSEVVLVKETDRFFSAEEYDALIPGLFQHLLALRASGQAEFSESDDGRYLFRNRFIRATGCRRP